MSQKCPHNKNVQNMPPKMSQASLCKKNVPKMSGRNVRKMPVPQKCAKNAFKECPKNACGPKMSQNCFQQCPRHAPSTKNAQKCPFGAFLRIFCRWGMSRTLLKAILGHLRSTSIFGTFFEGIFWTFLGDGHFWDISAGHVWDIFFAQGCLGHFRRHFGDIFF